jgi:hypothetical protein
LKIGKCEGIEWILRMKGRRVRNWMSGIHFRGRKMVIHDWDVYDE